MPLGRRRFMTATLGLLGVSSLPRLAHHALAREGSGGGLRFIFVVNRGGWDPLLTLAPMSGASLLTLPPATTRAVVGGMPIADAAARPTTRRFFERWGPRTLILHGLSVRSVAHEVCERTMMTGQATGDGADLGTRLAVDGAPRALSHLVIAGPSFPGAYPSFASRVGAAGQLQGLIDASALVDGGPSLLPTPARDLVDRLMARRRAAFVAAAPERRDAWRIADEKAVELVARRRELDLRTDGGFEAQARLAVDLLTRGLVSCLTISPPLGWDTHVDSDNQQSQLWEAFFTGLSALVSGLASTPDPTAAPGRTMLDGTIVVALSEMARTPGLNADAGRDHWPWTSAMLIGGGLSGGRAIGGYDDGYRGLGVDPEDGSPTPARPAPTPADLGATLYGLAGLDPDSFAPGAAPIGGIS